MFSKTLGTDWKVDLIFYLPFRCKDAYDSITSHVKAKGNPWFMYDYQAGGYQTQNDTGESWLGTGTEIKGACVSGVPHPSPKLRSHPQDRFFVVRVLWSRRLIELEISSMERPPINPGRSRVHFNASNHDEEAEPTVNIAFFDGDPDLELGPDEGTSITGSVQEEIWTYKRYHRSEIAIFILFWRGRRSWSRRNSYA